MNKVKVTKIQNEDGDYFFQIYLNDSCKKSLLFYPERGETESRNEPDVLKEAMKFAKKLENPEPLLNELIYETPETEETAYNFN